MRRVPGKHEPNAKNRSSKHLSWFTKMKPVYRSMCHDWLKKQSDNGNALATAELNRRDRIHDKNEVRKQRYVEKLAAKRNNKTTK